MKKKVLLVLASVLLLLAVFSVTAFATDTEYTSGDYKYILLEDGTAEITAYSGTKSALTLPSVIDGKKVTSLGADVFRYSSNVKNVVIPDSVANIDETFFKSKVENIVLGSEVKSISERAFYLAWSLKAIAVSNANPYFSSVNGILYDKAKTRLVCVPAGKEMDTFRIPNGVKTLGVLAMREVKIKQLIIPSTVTKIESYAITVQNLESLTIPGSVKTMESNAVYYCQSLKTLKIQKGYLKEIPNSAINSCRALERIEIPSNVTSIGNFYDCNALKEIVVDPANKYYSTQEGTLFNKAKTELVRYPVGKADKSYTVPDSVKVINRLAFIYAGNLEALHLHSGITTIGDTAFGYSKIKNIYYEGTKAQYQKIPRDTYFDKYVTYNYRINRPIRNLNATQTASSVTLTWDKVKNETGYRVFLKTADGWKKLADTTAVKYTLTGLTAGTKYVFAVKSYAVIGGKTVWGTELAQIITATQPAATKTVKAASADNTVTLAWSKVAGASGYRVFLYNNGWKAVKTTAGTSCVISGLTAGTNYTFAIRPYVSVARPYVIGGIELIWAPTIASINTATAPLAPKTVKQTAGASTTATVKWDACKNATGYRVYKYNAATKKWETAVNATTSLTAVVKGLSANRKYFVAVKPYTKTASGIVWGKTITQTIVATAPATPTLKLASSAKGRVTMAWTDVAGETGYQVYYSTNAKSGYQRIANYNADVTSAFKTGLNSGTTYYFRVRSYRAYNGIYVFSPFSPVVSVKIK